MRVKVLRKHKNWKVSDTLRLTSYVVYCADLDTLESGIGNVISLI